MKCSDTEDPKLLRGDVFGLCACRVLTSVHDLSPQTSFYACNLSSWYVVFGFSIPSN